MDYVPQSSDQHQTRVFATIFSRAIALSVHPIFTPQAHIAIVIDRFILLAIAPLTLAGGAVGWTWSDFAASLAAVEQPELAPVSQAQSAVIPPTPRSRDGLFRAMVTLDGHKVPMVIDTGATRSVLSAHLASTMKLTTKRRLGGYLATISGTTAYRTATVQTVRIGSLSLTNVDMIVVPGPGTISLLGQDILRKIGPMRIDADQITFE